MNKKIRVNFQSVYKSIKNDLTYDIKENLKILINKIDLIYNIKIDASFVYQFDFFILNDTKNKDLTNKQMMTKFFDCFKVFYESNNQVENENEHQELIKSIINKNIYKKYITFIIRNNKLIIYIYNNEDKEKIKSINNYKIALNKKEIFIFHQNRKIKKIDTIINLINESLKDYIY